MADNPFEPIARLYDWEHDPYVEDLGTYVAMARRFGGPVLELACGSGRVLAPLAAAGLRCTGVDSSPAMLDRAAARLRAANLDATLVQQDVTRLHLDGPFRTILFPLDGLALLTERQEQLSVLRATRRLVAHDGALVLDVNNGNLRGGNEAVEELLHDRTASDPETGRSITKWVVRRPNAAEQLDELLFLYDELDEGGRVVRTAAALRLRWFTRNELELLLESTGWRVDELYGDYDLEPFGPTSPRLLMVARPSSFEP